MVAVKKSQGFTPGQAFGGIGAVGGAMSAFAGLAAANSQAELQQTQAEMRQVQADYNNMLLDLQKDDLNAQADAGAAERGREAAKMIGSQKAALAGANIALDSELALEMEASEREISVEDQRRIKINAYKQTLGIENQQMQNTWDARSGMISSQASQAQTLATGGANFASGLVSAARGYSSTVKEMKNISWKSMFD